MATTLRRYVFATFILSCTALALLVTALATQMWVVSDLQSNADGSQALSSVNYGLFTGRYDRQMAGIKSVHELRMTCLMSENVCAWSCMGTSEAREEEIQTLHAGSDINIKTCPYSSITTISASTSAKRTSTYRTWLRAANDTDDGNWVRDEQFINAGLWVSTVFFIIVALIVTAIATVLAVVNAAKNPSRTWLAMDGLYFWNGGAAGLDLVVLILWGSQFASILTDNVVIADVIRGYFSSAGQASLGFSYWLVLVAMFTSIACVGVLAVRDYLVSREPPAPTFSLDVAAKDGTLILY